VGISRANNQGMRAGRGRYVLLLNPDTAVLDRAVERMVAFMDDHPEVGACGSKLLYPDGTPQASTALPLPRLTGALYNYSALFERFPRLGGTLAREWTERVDETRPVGYCSTACLLVSRTCVEEVGMMDEDFFLYGDDVDWCKQMWEGGWPVFYLPEARVVHYEGAATGSLAPRRWRELQGTLQYLRKWHGEAYARSYRAVVWLCSLYRYGKIRLRELRGAADEEGLGAYCAFYRAVLTGEFEQAPAHGGQGG
jgi:GT2 family glycosyltransferase